MLVQSLHQYWDRNWLNGPHGRLAWNFYDNPTLTTSNAAESTNWRITMQVEILILAHLMLIQYLH